MDPCLTRLKERCLSVSENMSLQLKPPVFLSSSQGIVNRTPVLWSQWYNYNVIIKHYNDDHINSLLKKTAIMLDI